MGDRSLVTCTGVAIALALVPSCYLSHERPDPPETCSTTPIGGCASWQSAGPIVPLTERTPPGDFAIFGSATERECGALVAWSVGRVGPDGSRSVRLETRTIDWSGEPTAPILAHPALDRSPPGTPGPLLMRGPGGAAAIIADCEFVPLDESGRERGSAEPAEDAVCTGLAATEGGYSYLTVRATGMGELQLTSVGAGGDARSDVMLFGPTLRTIWSRLVFDDGSFLAYSYTWDFITPSYLSRLQRFDAGGRPVAPEVELGDDVGILRVSETIGGALAVWTAPLSGGLPLRVRPIDRDGRARGETRELPASGSLYALAITTAPDGDAALAWVESRDHPGISTPEWLLQVVALDPGGVPRAAPTAIPTESNNATTQILVEPSGERALVLFANDSGVFAHPLICSR